MMVKLIVYRTICHHFSWVSKSNSFKNLFKWKLYEMFSLWWIFYKFYEHKNIRII